MAVIAASRLILQPSLELQWATTSLLKPADVVLCVLCCQSILPG